MLAEVRRRTEPVVLAVDALQETRHASDASGHDALDAKVREHVSRWMREMEALGVAVRGPWRIEFETSDGAFCWVWPEARLAFRPRGAKDAMPVQ